MNKKQRLLIAVDMDGTLLTTHQTISEKTKKLLSDLHKQGHLVVIASGRPPRAILNYYEDLGLTTPIITYNGAYIYNPHDPTFPIKKMIFNNDEVKDLLVDLQPVMDNVMCENNDHMWFQYEDVEHSVFFNVEGVTMHYGDFELFYQQQLYSIIGIQKPEVTHAEIQKIIDRYEKIGVWFWHSSPYFELYNKGFSKGSGLKYVANYFKIPKENIIVFGDADNDIDMFEIAHVSVAMKNAKSHILKIASRVSLFDNNNEGIYHTLKEIIKEYKI